MKQSYRVSNNPELPQNGNLVHVRAKEDLLAILGFCSSAEARAGFDGKAGESLDVFEADCADERLIGVKLQRG